MELISYIAIIAFFWLTFYLFKGLFSDKPNLDSQLEDAVEVEILMGNEEYEEAKLKSQLEYLALDVVKVELLIENEEYEEAKLLCEVICEGVHNAFIYHYLFIINAKLDNPQEAKKNICLALELTNNNRGAYYFFTLVEAIDIAVQCGDLDMAIKYCERFNELNSTEHEDIAHKVNVIYKDEIKRRKNRDDTLAKFDNNLIDLPETLNKLISDKAFFDTFKLLLKNDSLSDLAYLEFTFIVLFNIGDSHANEFAYELYKSNVKTHLVYQCMHSYTIGEENEKLKKNVLAEYRDGFGESAEYKEFFSSLA